MIASPQPRSKRAARDGLAPSVPSCPCGGGDHFVQFYEQDSYLNESVARFLNDGFQKGARAVVIATKAHATEIDKWLAMLRRALEANYDRLDQLLAEMDSSKEKDWK